MFLYILSPCTPIEVLVDSSTLSWPMKVLCGGLLYLCVFSTMWLTVMMLKSVGYPACCLGCLKSCAALILFTMTFVNSLEVIRRLTVREFYKSFQIATVCTNIMAILSQTRQTQTPPKHKSKYIYCHCLSMFCSCGFWMALLRTRHWCLHFSPSKLHRPRRPI